MNTLVGVTFYDPDLAKFGNAMSPFVEMPTYGAASRAMTSSFEDRYGDRANAWDWDDWFADGAGVRPEDFFDAKALASGEFLVGAPSDGMRWYSPVSDGTFLDIVDDFRKAGATCSEGSLSRCTWRGTRFTLVHDVEGGIRCYMTDAGSLGSPGAWALVETILTRGTARTSGTFDDAPGVASASKRAIVSTLAIAAVTGLVALRSDPKYTLEIIAVGAAGVALSLAVDMGKLGRR